MKKNTKLKLLKVSLVLLFVGLMSLCTVTNAVYTPESNPVVVLLDHDPATMAAIHNIRYSVPNLLVVDYHSLSQILTFMKNPSTVIWLSHGSKEGVLLNSKLMSWKELAQSVNTAPGINKIVFTCNSAFIVPYLKAHTHAITFNKAIDANIMGLFLGHDIAQAYHMPSVPLQQFQAKVYSMFSSIMMGKLPLLLLSPITIKIDIGWFSVSAEAKINIIDLGLYIAALLALVAFGKITTSSIIPTILAFVEVDLGAFQWAWESLIVPALEIFLPPLVSGGMSYVLDEFSSLLNTLLTKTFAAAYTTFIITCAAGLMSFILGWNYDSTHSFFQSEIGASLEATLNKVADNYLDSGSISLEGAMGELQLDFGVIILNAAGGVFDWLTNTFYSSYTWSLSLSI